MPEESDIWRHKLPLTAENCYLETTHPFGAHLPVSGGELAADLRAGLAKALDEPNVLDGRGEPAELLRYNRRAAPDRLL